MGKEYYIGTGFKNQGTVYKNGVYTACVLCDIHKKTNTCGIVVPEQAESVGRKIQEYNDTYTYKHTIGIKQRDVVLSTILAVEADQLAVWKNIVNGKTLYNVYFVIETNTTGALYAGNDVLVAKLYINYVYRVSKLNSKYPYTPSVAEHKICMADLNEEALQYLLFGKYINTGAGSFPPADKMLLETKYEGNTCVMIRPLKRKR